MSSLPKKDCNLQFLTAGALKDHGTGQAKSTECLGALTSDIESGYQDTSFADFCHQSAFSSSATTCPIEVQCLQEQDMNQV